MRKMWGQLRAWNRRQVDWARRHPWRNGAVFATAYCASWLWHSLRSESGPSLPFIGVLWIVGFVMAGALGKARASQPQREPLSTPPTDLTLRGDSGPGMGEDGRRWRTGSP